MECLISRMFLHHFLEVLLLSVARIVILIRVLLKSRSGFGKSDSVVNHLIRNIIQTGCLAMIWAVVALGSWFLLPNVTIYRLFDMTSGTVYAHVSGIFLTQLSHSDETYFRQYSTRFWHASICVGEWRQPSKI